VFALRKFMLKLVRTTRIKQKN